ncbi:MAG: UDP-N-acetylmuramoyl-L-alanine--D-glutamate ligase [Acidiferrobacterales bacterium]
MNAKAMMQTKKQLAVVVGLGNTGLSVVPHLLSLGYEVEIHDSRDLPPRLSVLQSAFPNIPVITGQFSAERFSEADLLVVSPGVPLADPAVARARSEHVETIGDIELFARAAKSPIVAISGANGKSTVSALVAEMLSAAGLDTRLGGNIGVPAMELLQQHEPDVYVLELSSFQLETTTSLNAIASTVLNISEDHMDRYRSIGEYADIKAGIYKGDGIMVLNIDDDRVVNMAIEGRKQIKFGISEPEHENDFGVREQDGQSWLARGTQTLLAVSEIRLPGRHNVSNVLAAYALSSAMGVSSAAANQAIREFRGLPHRCQLVAESQGVTWIDDSKATNVGSANAALNGMDRAVIWIAGGDGKNADFSPLKQAVKDHARHVVLIGRDANLIEAALEDVVPVHHAGDMADAVKQASALSTSGDIVLLSPACASFDMFKNFSHRGDVFAEKIRELAAR